MKPPAAIERLFLLPNENQNHLFPHGCVLYSGAGCHSYRDWLMLSGAALQILLRVLILVGTLLVGFGGGWIVHGWKSGAKMAELESRDAVVTAANEKCAKDVESTKAGIKQVTDALAAKEREAQDAMKSAEVAAKKHSDLARKIKNAPTQKGETQCQAVEREQISYVESRHRENGDQ